MSSEEYEVKKEEVADELVQRLEACLFRCEGSYNVQRSGNTGLMGCMAPFQQGTPGILEMPFIRTAVKGLYCIGDSTFSLV